MNFGSRYCFMISEWLVHCTIQPKSTLPKLRWCGMGIMKQILLQWIMISALNDWYIVPYNPKSTHTNIKVMWCGNHEADTASRYRWYTVPYTGDPNPHIPKLRRCGMGTSAWYHWYIVPYNPNSTHTKIKVMWYGNHEADTASWYPNDWYGTLYHTTQNPHIPTLRWCGVGIMKQTLLHDIVGTLYHTLVTQIHTYQN